MATDAGYLAKLFLAFTGPEMTQGLQPQDCEKQCFIGPGKLNYYF